MDSTSTAILNRVIPSAESPNWPLFVLLIIVTLALGPKALDAWRRYRYETKPGIERRKEETCAVHTTRIQALEARLSSQEEELNDLRHQFQEGFRQLRDFIEEKFQQDRDASQRERLALETRITAHMTAIVGMIPRAEMG